MNFQSEIHTVEDALAAQEYFHSRKWTDGLPIVPPTADLVKAHLEWAMLEPDSLIGVEPVRARPIIAEKLAINSVMAGCLPMHFPLVVQPGRRCCRMSFFFMEPLRLLVDVRFYPSLMVQPEKNLEWTVHLMLLVQAIGRRWPLAAPFV